LGIADPEALFVIAASRENVWASPASEPVLAGSKIFERIAAASAQDTVAEQWTRTGQ